MSLLWQQAKEVWLLWTESAEEIGVSPSLLLAQVRLQSILVYIQDDAASALDGPTTNEHQACNLQCWCQTELQGLAHMHRRCCWRSGRMRCSCAWQLVLATPRLATTPPRCSTSSGASPDLIVDLYQNRRGNSSWVEPDVLLPLTRNLQSLDMKRRRRGHRLKCWECGVKKKAPCGKIDREDLPWCCHRRLGEWLPKLNVSFDASGQAVCAGMQ